MLTLKKNQKPLLSTLLCVVALFVLGCDQDSADTPAPLAAIGTTDIVGAVPTRPISAYHNKVLAEARRSTARYHRVEAALEDGYVLNSHCVSGPMGGMGYHYLNFALVDGTVDPARPEALVYEPQKNGKLKLVAVEYLVMAAQWAGEGLPKLGDQVFEDYSLGGGGPSFPNYQLHAWIWKHNPSGMHTPSNPNVSCEYGD